ncbi:hypothetical protein HJG53_12475 [Sphingomonas sp. ID1715]|uniref:hypothetical protein n=1 Tax=Sphingomonas sp. ID1715 TaxID=1656898 RepID=UPI0014881AF4|nr:hypothetical protein [Sphingomonas sp. ID1715]NNM77724.1 hypothetical protein [Sphingomonas sp. ID1715]
MTTTAGRLRVHDMNQVIRARVLPLEWAGPQASDPPALKIRGRGLAAFVGPAISLAVLVAVVMQLRTLDWRQIWAIVPSSPLFWTVFAATYFAAPFADWIIFRKLWGIPASGFAALLKKLIGNEILLGYIGEVYFYDWARKRADITTAPFGAVKDVTILSALVGNAVTLAMLVFAWPFLGILQLGTQGRTLLLSVAAVILTSLAAMVLRRRLFSLPPRELRFVAWAHLGRIIASTVLAAMMWHLVLPQVALVWWLLLATFRLLLSRLPFLPNKDIVFAGMAVFLVGHERDIGAMMTMIASCILAAHLLLGAALTSGDLANRGKRA